MGLTLNIIEHELKAFGNVERTTEANPTFTCFRVFIEATPSRNDDTLYLCASHAEVAKVVDSGHGALYVNPDDSQPDQQAILSVTGGESALIVFNALLDIAHRFAKWEHDMDAVRYSNGDLQELIDLSSSFLVNNVVIVDPALKLLAYTSDVPCDDPITVELINHGYHTEENIAKFKLHKRFQPWAAQTGFIINDSLEICKYVTVVKSFKTKSSFSLIVIMMCNVMEPNDYLFDVFDMFASRIGYYAARDYPDDKPAGNSVDTFLKDLFLNEPGEEAAVRERCRIAGMPFDARFCLFHIGLDESNVPVSRLLSDVSRLAAPAKTTLVDDAIVVLCFNCHSDKCALHCASNSCPLGRTSLSARLDDMMARFDLLCGRSSKFTKLSSARIAFEQAKTAYHIGKKRIQADGPLNIPHNWGRIVSFDACYVDYLVDSISPAGVNLVGAAYAGYVIDAIAKQDALARTDNYFFLYEYLMGERRASIVAERTHMHRNNVKYRIDRIERQYGFDTSDPQLRFDFLLAYRIREAAVAQAE